jgi:IS30 family transposase
LKGIYGIKTYFCDPWQPWQRGLNENTNGLLRQRFPKNNPSVLINQERLDWALNLLNNRPRKTLDYLSPIQILNFHCVLLK